MSRVPPVVFRAGVEAVFWLGPGKRLDPGSREALAALGLDVSRPPHAEYPMEVWRDGVRLCSAALFPELSPEDGLYHLGLGAIRGFAETLTGGAVMALLRVIGVRRALARVCASFRKGNTFTRFSVCFPEARLARVVLVGHQGVPHHFMGMLVGGALLCGARQAEGHMERVAPDRCEFVVSWT